MLQNAPIRSILFRFSLPAIIGTTIISLYNIIDRIFIGQWVGADAIMGMAITFPIMNLSSALGMLIGIGAAARISIALGEKNHERAEQIFGNSFLLLLIVAATYLTVFAIFLEDILVLFGASERSLPYAYDFTLYLLPGMLIMNLCYSLNNVIRATGYPRKAMFTLLIGAGLNILLAPLFIYYLDWGVKGAAIATDISMGVSAMFVFAHFISKDSVVHFKRGIYRLRWDIIKAIITIGAAPFMINVTTSSVNAFMNNILYEYGGDYAVGAAGIYITFASLVVMVIVGICQGMQPILGYNYGLKRYDRVRRTYYLGVMLASAYCMVMTAIALISPQWIALAFTDDMELISVSSNGLRIATMFLWVAGFQIVSSNMFQAIGMAGKSILLSMSRQIIFFLPAITLLPNMFGLDGVWGAYPVADFSSTLVAAVLVYHLFRTKLKLE